MKYLESEVKANSLSLSCWMRRETRKIVLTYSVRVLRPTPEISSLLNNAICQDCDDLLPCETGN